MAEGVKAPSPPALPSAPPASGGGGAAGTGSAARASAAVDPLIGRTVNGRFKITSLLAKGGMGRVYRAEQAPLGRICALKILTTTYEGEHDPEFHKRFFLEASIASKITHPNSVTIFDYGQTEDDIYYMAMEYLEGVTLHRAIRLAGFFPEERAAHIGRQVCRALREAHALGCIHRDLKPANIFLTEHGDEPDFVKVLDFGLVKNVLGEGKPEEQLTQTGLFMGSPKYMAPEQIRGERVDVRTDIYSLGIIMYEMLTGKVPFERLTSLNTLMAQVNDKPPALRETNPAVNVSAEMEDLVIQCMAKDPNDRASTMDEVLAILKRMTAPGFGLTGEYRALGSAASGAYSRAEPTPGPARAPSSGSTTGANSVAVPSSGEVSGTMTSGAAAADGPSVSVSMTSMPMTRPSGIAGTTSGAPPGPASVPPPDFRRRNGRNLGAVAGVVALLGLAVFFFVRAGNPPASTVADPPPIVPSTVAPPAPEAPTPVANPVAPPPAPVATTLTVHFVTEPPGASVKENGAELCATTPCDHAYPADPTTEHKVVFNHGGYRPETRVVHANDAQVALTLVAAKAWVPPPRGAGPKPADSSGAPQGFKDIPY
jgi:serine/threonine protein kinase